LNPESFRGSATTEGIDLRIEEIEQKETKITKVFLAWTEQNLCCLCYLLFRIFSCSVGKLLVATADAFGDQRGEKDLPTKTRKPVVSESLALSEAEWGEAKQPNHSAKRSPFEFSRLFVPAGHGGCFVGKLLGALLEPIS
jgi:hypothetical protein